MKEPRHLPHSIRFRTLIVAAALLSFAIAAICAYDFFDRQDNKKRIADQPVAASQLLARLRSGEVPADERVLSLAQVAEFGGQAEIDELWSMAKKAEDANRTELLGALLNAASNRKMKPSDGARDICQTGFFHKEASAIRLAGVWRVEEARSFVSTLAHDIYLKHPQRRAAFESLVDYDDPEAWKIIEQWAKHASAKIGSFAIAAAARSKLKEAAEWTVVQLYSEFDITEDDLKTALDAIIQRKGGIDALDTAITNKRPPSNWQPAPGCKTFLPERLAMALRIVNASGRDVGKLTETLNSHRCQWMQQRTNTKGD